MSRPGERSFSHWGSVPTNSLEPMQAPTTEGSTATSKRRAIQRLTAARSAAVPMLAGYPRSASDVEKAATTAGGAGSIGVPIDRSTTPPSCFAAIGCSRSSRS